MATRYINGVLHEITKCYVNYNQAVCTQCGKVHGLAWVVDVAQAGWPTRREVARYCYDCTKNHWTTAFRLYRESLSKKTL